MSRTYSPYIRRLLRSTGCLSITCLSVTVSRRAGDSSAAARMLRQREGERGKRNGWEGKTAGGMKKATIRWQHSSPWYFPLRSKVRRTASTILMTSVGYGGFCPRIEGILSWENYVQGGILSWVLARVWVLMHRFSQRQNLFIFLSPTSFTLSSLTPVCLISFLYGFLIRLNMFILFARSSGRKYPFSKSESK